MTSDEFSRQYRHPNWQKKRLEVLERDNYTCLLCESKENQLHAHHLEYQRGKKVWEYPADNFLTLCADCHGGVTDLLTNIKRKMADINFICALSSLCELWGKDKTKHSQSVIYLLQESPDLLWPVYYFILEQRRKQNAPKTSKARAKR